jgi:MOSC domain-containing protein YiiM
VVEAIRVVAAAGEPVRDVELVRTKAGVGLERDRYALGRGHYTPDLRVSRDLTLIEAEVIEDLPRKHGIQLAPGETRRDVTTRGIRLNDLVGRRFWVGDVFHRGGLRADIVRGGRIRRRDRLWVGEQVGAASPRRV